jgi:hypothetical protein
MPYKTSGKMKLHVENAWDKEIRPSDVLNTDKIKGTSTTHFNIIP